MELRLPRPVRMERKPEPIGWPYAPLTAQVLIVGTWGAAQTSPSGYA